MARRPRIVIPGWPHHVTQRGNHRQAVFFSDQDRLIYMDLMKRFLEKYELILIGHSLMTNHVHHVIIPPTAEAKRKQIQEAIRRATSSGSFWGPDETAERLERELGRPVQPRKKGTR